MTWPVDPQLYLTYLGVLALLVVTPGPAILFAVATGVTHGMGGVVRATLGMNLGNLAWFAAAALGLTALASAVPDAFRLLRWLGVAYLIWIGGRNLWAARHAQPPHGSGIRPTGRPFRDGLLVQLSNPKALIFITAILPPFIAIDRSPGPQLAVFAATGVFMDAIAMLAYGFGGAALAVRMSRPRFRQAFSAVAGLLFIAAAVLILTRP